MAWSKEQRDAFAKAYNSGSSEADARKAAGVGTSSSGGNGGNSGHLGGYTASETAKKGLEGLNTGSYLSGVQNPWTAKINSNNPFQDYSEDILGYDDWAAKNGYNTATPSMEWNNKVKDAYDQYRQGFFDKDPNYDIKHKKFQDWNDEQARYMQESDKWNELHANDAEEYAGKEGLKYLADLGIAPDSEDFNWIMTQIYTDPQYAHLAESIKDSSGDLMSLADTYSQFYNGDDIGVDVDGNRVYSGGYKDKLEEAKRASDPNAGKSEDQQIYEEAKSIYDGLYKTYMEQYKELVRKNPEEYTMDGLAGWMKGAMDKDNKFREAKEAMDTAKSEIDKAAAENEYMNATPDQVMQSLMEDAKSYQTPVRSQNEASRKAAEEMYANFDFLNNPFRADSRQAQEREDFKAYQEAEMRARYEGAIPGTPDFANKVREYFLQTHTY